MKVFLIIVKLHKINKLLTQYSLIMFSMLFGKKKIQTNISSVSNKPLKVIN